MTDLDRQIHNYIDAIAEPVSVGEITRTAAPTRRRLHPAAAVLVGIGIALVPMLGLFLNRLGSDREVAQSTTSIAPPTTVAPVLTLPNVVGMSEPEARQLLEDAGLVVAVRASGGGTVPFRGNVVAQEPAAGTAMAPGETVLLDVAAVVPCAPSPATAPGAGQVNITVLFGCGGDGNYPGAYVATTRLVPEGGGEAIDRIQETLLALLAGPTPQEAEAGLFSFFGGTTAGALNEVTLTDGHLVADFNDAILVNNASTSSGGLFFNDEIRANLFQHPEVETIELHINGSCEGWSAFFQSDGCWVIARGDWEYTVAGWDELRSGGSTTIFPIPAAGLGEGVVLSELTVDGDRIGWRSADGATTRDIVVFSLSRLPGRQVASDRMGGIVYETADHVHWLAAGASTAIDLTPGDGLPGIIDLQVIESSPGRQVVVITTSEEEWAVDLATLAFLDPAEVRAGVVGLPPYAVHLEEQRPNSSSRAPVDNQDFNPTFLVVTDQQEFEVTRFRVSIDGEPSVALHDFDGRRVLVSRTTFEPAAGPQTFLVFDLECGQACTTSFVTGPAHGALSGPVTPATNVAVGWQATLGG